MPLGERNVLQRCLDLFALAGIDQVYTVLGHRREELLPIVRSAGAVPVVNSDYDRGMFSSVQAGAVALSEDTDAFFVLPVDVPLVRFSTLNFLRQAADAETEADAFIPVFDRYTGHPPLLRSSLRPAIAGHDGARGLRGVLDKCRTRRVSVPDQNILLDLDTPEQYSRAMDRLKSGGVPSSREAEILLDLECRDNPEVAAHCRAVARAADSLTEAVNIVSPGLLHVGLVHAGALLHDLAKGSPHHARAGAKRLRELGFPERLAGIVEVHADFDPRSDSEVTEEEVVYLADKYVRGTVIVPLRQRFDEKHEKFAGNPEARQAVLRRRRQAEKIRDRVKRAARQRPSEIIA